MKTLRIVGIGGGTGLPVLLSGLAKEPRVQLSAVVTVADDGGSSGRLRESLGLPAVGDLRNCLVAMSGHRSALANLFQHRFSNADGLDGHALGNLVVAALYQRTGSLTKAIQGASRLLPLKGRAFPATDILTTLCASLEDGTVIRGESRIPESRKKIRRVWLEPENPAPTQGVLETIAAADAIVLAPGSLYTSLLPNLLVSGVASAVRQSRAAKILVCNLLTQPGETDGFSASDHLRVVEQCLGRGVVQYCVVNSATQHPRRQRTRPPGWEPVTCDKDRIVERGAIPIEADVQGTRHGCHDAAKLGRLVTNIARTGTRASQTAAAVAPPSHSEKSFERNYSVCINQSAIV